MVQLLIAADAPDERSIETRFGGRPLVSDASDFAWPVCAECGGAMQFLGQIAVPSTGGEPALLALFMCVSERICSTWEPDSGANRAMLMLGERFTLRTPAIEDESTLRAAMYGAMIWEMAGDDYDDARRIWHETHEGGGRSMLGCHGGEPAWIQFEEVPVCGCGAPMAFVAQLEEGPDYRTAMNFGGGSAYVFRCGDHAAAMLWQQ